MGSSPVSITIVSPVEKDGVLLLPASGPRSVGVVLKNATQQSIIAYCVCWKFTDSGGTVRTHVIAKRSFNGAAIPPNGSKFLSCNSGTGVGSEAQSHIEVSLELAVFDDGTAVGPDGANVFPRFKAWVDAERDFVHLALADGDFSLTVRNAREQGLAALPADDAKTSASLLMAAEMASDYRTCYQFASAYFASQVQEWIDKTGPIAAIERVRLTTNGKHYPTLHKKQGMVLS